tara:strand:- start:122 stop:544 length:423 start_codon:yes stop_codon:yes gene_type:complete
MTKPLGKWKLPQPTDVQINKEWVDIPRIARTIPFGYEVDPDDSGILKPIPDELNKLQQAKKYLKQYSYREVANWLSAHTGRSISHVGLMKRVKHERSRKQQATSLRRWAEYAEAAIAKAETIETKRLDCESKAEETTASV